eukprot:1528519-Ditylum_brightwellii.AAC.1
MASLGHVSHSMVHGKDHILLPHYIGSSKDVGAYCSGGSVIGLRGDVVDESHANDYTMMSNEEGEKSKKCS